MATVLDGPLMLLLPGMAAVSEVRGLMEKDAIWPEADRERLRVTAVSMAGGPAADEEPPAAVIIAGLTRAADSDDTSFRDARAWLQLSTNWLCALLYLWTLIAPKCFPDRDFS